MRLYPSLPGPLRRTIALDVLVVLLLALFAWLGLKVHDTVSELNALSRGVVGAGTSVQETLREAGDAVGGAPIVGGDLRDSLQGAGREAGGAVVAAGREGERGVDSAASLLGTLTWLIPSLLLLLRYVPDRVRQAERLTAGARALADLTGDRRRLVAQRAAFGLPYGILLRHTRDPLGDLEAGRHDALVAAELESVGLRAPARR
jgi:hypothetical protein